MKISLLLLLLCLTFASAEVVVLTTDNFEDVIGGKDDVLVNFFAPWCGQCKKLAEPYKAASTELEGIAILAEVNCDDNNKDLCSKYGVKKYPAIKWFPKGTTTPTDYNGMRDEEDIKDWVNYKVSPPEEEDSFPVISLDEKTMEEASTLGVPLFIKFFTPWNGKCRELAPQFKDLRDFYYFSDIIFAEVNCEDQKDLCLKYKVKRHPTLLLIKDSESKPEKYKGEKNPEKMFEYINKNTDVGRNKDGTLQEHVGRILELDSLVSNFADLNTEEKKLILAKVKEVEVVERYEIRKEIYVKIIERALKDNTYVWKEISRLESLLGKPMKRHQRERFLLRANILKAFT